ncbi:hypothetical protein BAUCODRAFT_243073 [Baudoinia panamericana UAMH 10762]|uniref:Zn(2)-C6 fungal-type domain-containing protein n=1 Tax=Baudoinia panamericana (strain UAMH 10762) TaxID=717646 RepID=M2N3E0_BAUPA|nr:uncharacterized protein BAUCODRAFT_243073 [Baudoinia panamericana UAMH 10762]EMC93489.1 hypothetical protein BAUCODRAFT_243073 [Baudoinia panamericana UAMH 10762]
MAPGTKSESSNGDSAKSPGGEDTAAAEATLKARLSRKRTKTGCLTCRKRRIKCTEERPVCRNCIKSKRHCEGYNQRVVFKPPQFDYRPAPHGGAHITFQAGPVPGPSIPYRTEYLPPQPSFGTPLQLLPRPLETFVPPPIPQPHAYGPQHHYSRSHQFPLGDKAQNGAGYAPPSTSPIHTQQPLQPHDFAVQPPTRLHQTFPTNSREPHTQLPPGAIPFRPADPYPPQTQRPTTFIQDPSSAAQGAQWYREPLMLPPNLGDMGLRSSPAAQNEPAQTNGYALHDHVAPNVPRAHEGTPDLFRPLSQPPLENGALYNQTAYVPMAPLPQPVNELTPEFWEHEAHHPPSNTTNQWLSEAAVEVQDDDYYDVNSDEEMDIETSALVATDRDRQRTLSRILHGNHISIQDMQTRRYDTFLYDGMLDVYRVEEHANPLKNAATARVFAHFISVTGPSLSIFERHPRNTSVLFTQGPIPFSQQGLWTYTMPLAALHHQGLLHALLAIASLHIARLTGASVTPSMQHYAWALRRVHQCVCHPKKRLKLTTIAASMLLGFYEIMTADHLKWNTHLAGTRQLFVETDFVSMTRKLRSMQVDHLARQPTSMGRRGSECFSAVSPDGLLEQIPVIDENVVSTLVGKEVRWSEHGHVMTPQSALPQELDLGRFEVLKDLYWWYCKQDAYQSLISGNELLMDYERWADCPPRAPLGKPDAVYGTFDHLVLLLGRIADFSSRDRARKLKQMEQNGGHWRPAPSMKVPQPPQGPYPPPTPLSANGTIPTLGAHSALQSDQPQAPPQPMFYGMAPPPRQNVQMPSSYVPVNNGSHTPRSASAQLPIDLRLATQTALEEYGRIRAALFHFEQQLGEHFQELSSDYQPPLETPFGPAIFFRSYDIGCLWAIYYMAVIIAIRAHPHMPPAAHMAAGIAAQETAVFAQRIGQIVAGIVPGSPDQSLNPSLGAALCETCMPSFFAAVQYSDPRQRHETVTRIYSIAQRTGWGSAELIANGCETAWVKAAAAGRGPPYQRVVRREQSDDPRLNGSWETLDPNSKPNDGDDGDRRLVRTEAKARLNWAIGIMGTEDDVL